MCPTQPLSVQGVPRAGMPPGRGPQVAAGRQLPGVGVGLAELGEVPARSVHVA